MNTASRRSRITSFLTAALFVAVLAVPNVLFAQTFEGADQRVCGFFDDVRGLLNMASVAIVTIAVIIAGYQIAFAHKRISDVAPILIGGLLIGAAGQIASMIMPDNEACTTGTPTGSISIEASQYENA